MRSICIRLVFSCCLSFLLICFIRTIHFPGMEITYSSFLPKTSPTIFLITPTKNYLTRKADLTSITQTVSHLANVHWLVIEDGEEVNVGIEKLLSRSGIPHTYWATPASPELSKAGRGLSQRNAGLEWLRESFEGDQGMEGVVYFMDDDNCYDLRLFHFIRQVKKVGVWAVGFPMDGTVEAPIVSEGKVIGWNATYAGGQTRVVADMASFAVNLKLILNSNATFHENCKPGYLERCFVEQMEVTFDDLEPFGWEADADGLKEVLVWHLHVKKQYKESQKDVQGYQI